MLAELLSDLVYRLRAVFNRSAMERDLDEELRDHMAREAAASVRSGVDAETAARQARITIGGVENAKDAIRDARGVSWFEHLARDLRYAGRNLARTPAFTVAAVLSLGLGIGATTAMFSAFDALLLRPLPVREPNELVTFEMVFRDGFRSYNLSYGDFERIQGLKNTVAAATATSWAESFNVSADRRDASLARPAHVSVVIGNYFSVLGLPPQLGRVLSATDDGDDMGAHAVVVLSDAYWTRELNRSADVIGKPLFVNGRQYEIIGVAPKGFDGDWIGWPTDFWVPSSMIAQVHPEAEGRPRANYQFKVIARLTPGTQVARAQTAADVLYQQVLQDPPNGSGMARGGRLEVVSASRGYSPQRTSFGQPLTILMAIVATVMLIACANMANLQLARAVARQREIALRLALGAKRSRIIRQLMTESVLLATLGATLGPGLAVFGMSLLGQLAASGPVGGVSTSSNPLSVQMHLHVDLRVLGFAGLLCLVTSILFGLLPALRGSNVSLLPALAVGGQRAADSGRPAARAFLVVSQVALSLLLVVATGLFVRTLRNLERQNLGFERDHLLLVWTLPGHTGRSAAEIMPLWDEARSQLAVLPGVESIATSIEGLLGGGPSSGPLLGVVGSAVADSVRAQQTKTVSPGFFATIRQPLLVGRDFSRFDTDSAPNVAIINESLAKRLFPKQTAVGQRLVIRGANQQLDVIGVVADAVHSPRSGRALAIYYPPGQNLRRLSRGMTIVIRATGDPVRLANSVRQTLNEWNPQLPILNIDTADEQLDDVLFQERLVTSLSVAFATLALLLSCVGIYGVVSYITARRTPEIGIRMALGAQRLTVVRSVLTESLRLAAAGVVIGVVASLLLTRTVASVLYGITATDPTTIVASATLLLCVALMAGFIPAYRASRVSPMRALRID